MAHHLTAIPELLNTAAAAERLQMSTRAILDWAGKGKLGSILTPGGQRRYPAAAVEAVRAQMFEHADYQ